MIIYLLPALWCLGTIGIPPHGELHASCECILKPTQRAEEKTQKSSIAACEG
jgi:hypothetical protein